MRLLTWNGQDELTLTDDLVDKTPHYATLSHTWGLDSDEVTFADIQHRQGQDKPGYAKIRFCGKQARRDGIEYFWVDTCCINKSNLVELSEAIVSMFRWYRDAKKCYVYLSDVSLCKVDNVNDVQSTWEPSLRISRWFTRGWTLQELLAPAVVEFFSCEEDFIGTKQTLAQLIHEVTTLPLAALSGTPLAQFSIDERMRWMAKRRTKKTEDGAYCLLGIFDVFMPLIYGEGDRAFRRLRKEINDQSSSDVATRLGNVDEVRSPSSCRRPAPLTDVDDYIGRAVKTDQMAPILRQGEPGSAKRVRTSYDATASGPSNGRSHGTTTINTSHMLVMGDDIQHPDKDSQHNSMIIKEDKHTVLLKSLLFDRIDFRVNNVKKALFPTCHWLFRHPHFQSWYESRSSDQNSGFLWIKGKPGCGKSTLMKAALEWARRHKGRKRGRYAIVPYFFNARASASLEKSSLGLYRTVVYHLLSSYPPLRTLFAEKFALKDPGQSGEFWTAEELQEFLCDTIELEDSFRLCLFIDALDEAKYEDDVRQMISFLIQLSDRALAMDGSCRLQICLSSRHFPYITIGRGLSLVVEDQPEHGKDIENYITKELTCLDGPEKDEFRAQILKRSARIFLWVVLVVQILNKLDDRGAPLSDMRARLETIPAGLNELFKEILVKSDLGIETSILLFQWMVFRMRPLEPTELFIAMEFSRSPHNSTWILPTELSVPPLDRLTRFILNCSRGLVEVVEVAPSQAAVVQFIHETVREFLLDKDGLASIVRALATNLAGISHEILRIACLRCISTNDIPTEYKIYITAAHKNNASLEMFRSDMRLKLPFLDYAISHLFDHAEQAQQYDISQQAFLTGQVDAKGLWPGSHRLWWNVLERYKHKKVQPDVTVVQFFIQRQYRSLLSVLLSVSNTANMICGGYRSLLQFASYCGSIKPVQILLDRGADINAQGTDGTALYTASEYGHNEVVQALVDAGADVNAQGGPYGTALQAASEYGYRRVVQILIDAGADVNARERYGTALQAASFRERKKIVQILLSAGANVNVQGGRYGTALQAASVNGHYDIVQTLIDVGADINAQRGPHGNALQAAEKYGHGYVVHILLKHGAMSD